VQCPRCHTENREGRRFCGECGLSFASTCTSCGFLNEGTEKFCGGCGRSLRATASPVEPRFSSPQTYTPRHLAEKILTSKAALEGERKQVTVLFADL
jgi:Double zinc ribbon